MGDEDNDAFGARRRARQRTVDELLVAAEQLSVRLKRHLTALESGDLTAAADVAAVTRTALSDGQGDKVVRRLVTAHKLSEPAFLVSMPPFDDPLTVLSVGNLMQWNPLWAPGSRFVTLRDWLAMPAVVAPQATRRVTPWSEVIVALGNTDGAHVSTTVPLVLDEVDLVQADGATLSHWFAWHGGMVASTLLDFAIGAAGGTPAQFASQQPLGNLVLHRFALRSNTDDSPSTDIWARPHIDGRFLSWTNVTGQSEELRWANNDALAYRDGARVPREPGRARMLMSPHGNRIITPEELEREYGGTYGAAPDQTSRAQDQDSR